MRPMAPRPNTRSIAAGSTETRAPKLRNLAAVLGLAAPVLAVVATPVIAGPVRVPIGTATRQANALLPDFVIKCASVYPNPNYSFNGGQFNWLYLATVTVVNVGPTAAHIDVTNDPFWGAVSNLKVVTVGGYASNGGDVATPTLAPGQSFKTELGIYADLETNAKPRFTFRVALMNKLKESNAGNDTYGPVTPTDHNTCGAPQLSFRRPRSMKASRSIHPPVPHTPKLNPQPEPPSRHALAPSPGGVASHGAPITMHKIGLTPRPRVMTPGTLPPVRLPAGWSSSGGVLRAQRAGLRLRLSGRRTLVSRRAADGRLEYVVMDASGRIVKRERKNQRIRLAGGGTYILK